MAVMVALDSDMLARAFKEDPEGFGDFLGEIAQTFEAGNCAVAANFLRLYSDHDDTVREFLTMMLAAMDAA